MNFADLGLSEELQQAVADAFAAAGFTAPDMFVVRAAAGAARLA